MANSKMQKIIAFIEDEIIEILLFLPPLCMFLLIFMQWTLFYKEMTSIIFLLGGMFFAPLCIIAAICQLVRKKITQCIVAMLPVLLVYLFVFTPVRDIMIHSRHYVEFLIQKNIYIPEIAQIKNETERKQWHVEDNTWCSYWIVYDPTDEVVKKNNTTYTGTAPDGTSYIIAYYSVYKLGDHFYMRETNWNN